jgi:hypothetical protein
VSNVLLFKKKSILKFVDVASIALACLFILAVNIFRFTALEKSPSGFHVDELSAAVTIQCLATEGIDALDNPYPLFADLGYGSPRPPTYIYPAIIWTKIFGYSIKSFRAFSGFISIVMMIGLFFLGKLLFGWRYGLFLLLMANVSPFFFQTSRLTLEGGLAPCFFIWGLYFLLRSKSFFWMFSSGVFFSLAAYSYPPARLYIPLLIVPMLILKWKHHGLKKFSLMGFFTALAITIAPLAIKIFGGQNMQRFEDIGIFSEKYLSSIGKTNSLFDVSQVFIKNYLAHFDPVWIFVQGDKYRVYSTKFGGILSSIEAAALFVSIGCLLFWMLKVLRQKTDFKSFHVYFVLFLLFGVMASIVPSALTWKDIPHVYRLIGAWTFLVLLTAYIWWYLAKTQVWVLPVVTSCCIIFMSLYLNNYFHSYPKDSYWMFSTEAKVLALNSQKENDWKSFAYIYRFQNFHLRYYMMNYMEGQSCGSSQVIWKKVRKIK